MKYLKTYEQAYRVTTIIDLIKDLPFIQDMRECETHRLMYHTSKNLGHFANLRELDYVTINHRGREKSSDTPTILHKFVSEKIEKNIGWNPREDAIFVHNGNLHDGNSLYDSPNDDDDYGSWMNTEYGVKCIIIPAGDYKMAWNPLFQDMYMDLYDKYQIIKMGNWLEFWYDFPQIINGEVEDPVNIPNPSKIKEIKDIYADLQEYADTLNEDGLCEWLNSNVEGMLKSQQYYLINIELENQIKKLIWG